MKEKFAQLRIYTQGGNSRIRGVISFTEYLSSGTCEICGGVGHPHTSGHWLKTFCDECGVLYKYTPVKSDK
jgi:hypothetical protein